MHILNLPPGTTSLDFLDPVVSDLDRLIVTDWSCRDSRILGRAVSLTELDLWTDEQHPVELAGLTSLRAIAVEWQPELSSALQLTSLRKVLLSHPPANVGELLGPHVEELRLDQARLISSMFDAPPELTSFEISGTRSFDAASLADSSSLRSLTVANVRKLKGVVALSHRVRLKSLVLDNIRNLEDADELHLLRAESLLGIGRLFTERAVVAA